MTFTGVPAAIISPWVMTLHRASPNIALPPGFSGVVLVPAWPRRDSTSAATAATDSTPLAAEEVNAAKRAVCGSYMASADDA